MEPSMTSQDAALNTSAPLPAVHSTDQPNGSSCPIIRYGIALIAAAQFILFVYFLVRTAITSPISDMFTYIDVYLQFRAGDMSLLDYLWRAHGEHHLVWIRLLTWADVSIFHTLGIPFMAAAGAAVAATAILVWRQLQQADRSLGASTCLGLLAPMLFLSTANVTDCSVPINTTYPFTVFFTVLALVLFVGAEKHDFAANFRRIAALPAAFGASMGTAVGLLAWPILLWVAWRERLNRGWLIALASLGIIYSLFYAHGLNFLGLAPALKSDASSFFGATHLYKLSDYFFAFLGLPLTRSPALGLIGRIIGAVLFLAGLAILLVATFSNRLSTRLDRISIGMILLAFGAAALAAVGRSDLIEDVEIPVRYTMFTTALQVGLLCIALPRVVQQLAVSRTRCLQYLAGLALALVLIILQVIIGHTAARIANAVSRDADCFATGAETMPASNIVTRYPADAKKVLTALWQQGLLAPRFSKCNSHSLD
jgi:hypothetical protein